MFVKIMGGLGTPPRCSIFDKLECPINSPREIGWQPSLSAGIHLPFHSDVTDGMLKFVVPQASESRPGAPLFVVDDAVLGLKEHAGFGDEVVVVGVEA